MSNRDKLDSTKKQALSDVNITPPGKTVFANLGIDSSNTSHISSGESLLQALGINPHAIKCIKPNWKRTHYRAAINWLIKYKPLPKSSKLEQVRGFLEGLHHLCELEAWEKAVKLFTGGVGLEVSLKTPDINENILSFEQLHIRLGTFGYYHEQVKLYTLLLGKLDSEWDTLCLNDLGLAYHSLGNFQKAIECHLEQLKIAESIKYRESQEHALCNLGIIYTSIGEYQTAIEYYHQALAIARQISNKIAESKVIGNLGIVYRELGNYYQALQYHTEQLEICQNINDRECIGNALENLGIIYYFLGDNQLAIDHLQGSLLIASAIGKRISEAITLGALGNVHCALGDYSTGLDYHQQQLVLSREIGFIEGEEKALGNIGVVYHCLEQYDKAVEYHNQKINLARRLGDKQGEAYSLTNLGNTLIYLEQYEQAIDYHKKSLEISANIRDSHTAAAAIHNLSDTYRLLKQFDQATLLGMRSLYIFDCLKTADVETVLITLSKIALEIGIDEYADLVEQQLLVIEQEDGGQEAVVRLRELLFEN